MLLLPNCKTKTKNEGEKIKHTESETRRQTVINAAHQGLKHDSGQSSPKLGVGVSGTGLGILYHYMVPNNIKLFAVFNLPFFMYHIVAACSALLFVALSI